MKTIKLYYDDECPFCKEYSRYVKLKQNYEITVINARDEHMQIREFKKKGMDINKGMILEIDGQLWQGEEAILQIDYLLVHKTFSDKVRTFVTTIPYLMKLLYPVIKGFRYITLKIIGKNPNIKV